MTIKELKELAQKEATNPIIMGIISHLEEKETSLVKTMVKAVKKSK